MAQDAGQGDVDIAGGASTIRQALACSELDELILDIVPILIGSCERLFNGNTEVEPVPLQAEHSPWTTHVRYRIAS